MTEFFIPGISGDAHVVEKAYECMRQAVERDMGRPPTSRRILSVWARRGGVDCVTEVGTRDPLLGGIVVAIFDMGRKLPFVVWRKLESDDHATSRDTVGCNAYSVSEFDG